MNRRGLMQDAAGQDFRLSKFTKTLLTLKLEAKARTSSSRRTVAATSLKAVEEGMAFAEPLVSGWSVVNCGAIPAVVCTASETVSVRRTKEQFREAEVAIRTGAFFYWSELTTSIIQEDRPAED